MLTAAFLVHVLANSRIALWTYVGFVPPVAFALAPLAVVAYSYRVRDWWGVALAGMALIIGWTQIDANVGFFLRRDIPNTERSVTLFNWNTRFWNESDSPRFYPYLREQDADIYHLQERWQGASDHLAEPAEIARELPGYEVIARGELVTATRLPVQAISGSDEEKFLRVDAVVEGESVSFYNVHVSMPFGADIRKTFDRRQQQLRALQDDLADNLNRVVISGDFNATTSMGVMEWFFDRYRDSVSAARTLLPVSWGYHRLPRLKLWRLDYVFLDRRLRLDAHESIAPVDSDHWAQKVRFDVAI